jgi:hypothetical protein
VQSARHATADRNADEEIAGDAVRLILLPVLVAGLLLRTAVAADAPLVLQSKIALRDVKGGLGGISIDAARGRLLLAETHNDSFSVVDLAQGQVMRRITGLNLPQDVEYIGKVGAFVADTIYVSGGGDGLLRTYDGATLAPETQIKLFGEVEDIVLDDDEDRVLAGYGDGGIAIIDASDPRKTGEIALKAHPEEFMVDPAANRIYANVPNRGVVAVIDRTAKTVLAEWKLEGSYQFNAMAMTKGALLVAAQSPPRMLSISPMDGHVITAVGTCAEADMLLTDDVRRRAYVICGSGYIDVFQFDPNAGATPALVARLTTSPQAKTAFLDTRARRLYLGVPAKMQDPAAVWVYDVR